MTSFARVCAELDRRRHVTLGFERIEALLEAMGHPERDLPHVVQVVGTNGKGTTAVALAIALEELGHPSGAFLSPHVLSYTERVVLRGRQVSEEEFAAAMGETMELADRHGIPASQFEILTAGALKMFAEAGLSWAVLEAGLGARHDATSVARPDAVVLTNVAIDHTEYLGETVEEIAEEKLASLRPGATLFLGTDDERVVDLARSECRRLGVDLVEVAGLWKLCPRRVLPPTRRATRTWGSRSPGLSWRRVSPPRSEKGSRSASAKRFLDGSRCTRSGAYPLCSTGGTTRPGSRRRSRPCGSAYGERPLGVVFGALREKDIAGMLSGFVGEAARRRADASRGGEGLRPRAARERARTPRPQREESYGSARSREGPRRGRRGGEGGGWGGAGYGLPLDRGSRFAVVA